MSTVPSLLAIIHAVGLLSCFALLGTSRIGACIRFLSVQGILFSLVPVAEPKLVIAAGACAISGGLFRGHPEACDGVAALFPVDLYVPGCPPHPVTILDGLLRLLGRL